MADIITELRKPFPIAEVKWRVSRAGVTRSGKPWVKVLAYIDARAVMDRLDRTVGPAGWERFHSFGNNGEVLCTVKIKIEDQWISKTDGAAQTNFEGEKGGLSDAFKRACVNFGIGRYLYQIPEGFAEIQTEKPKSKDAWNYKYIDKKNDKSNSGGMAVYWQPPRLPGWAIPGQQKPAESATAASNDIINKQEQDQKQELAKKINEKLNEDPELKKKRMNIVQNEMHDAGAKRLGTMDVYQLKRILYQLEGDDDAGDKA